MISGAVRQRLKSKCDFDTHQAKKEIPVRARARGKHHFNSMQFSPQKRPGEVFVVILMVDRQWKVLEYHGSTRSTRVPSWYTYVIFSLMRMTRVKHLPTKSKVQCTRVRYQ